MIVAMSRASSPSVLLPAEEHRQGAWSALRCAGEMGHNGPSPGSSRSPSVSPHRGAAPWPPQRPGGLSLASAMGAPGLESDVWISDDAARRPRPHGIVGGWLATATDRHRPAPPPTGPRPTLDELYTTCGTDLQLSWTVPTPRPRRRPRRPTPSAPGTSSGSATPDATSWPAGGSAPRGPARGLDQCCGPSRTALSAAEQVVPPSASTR